MKEKCITGIGNTDFRRGEQPTGTGIGDSGTNQKVVICLCPYFYKVWRNSVIGLGCEFIVGHLSCCVAVSFTFVVGPQFLL